jgi:electron transport complex protein RnfB
VPSTPADCLRHCQPGWQRRNDRNWQKNLMEDKQDKPTRREFLSKAIAGVGIAAIACAAAHMLAAGRAGARRTLWQLDPNKCIQCGGCATNCVLNPSAVKCVHAYAMCGYCQRCFGFFDPRTSEFTSAAENQTCPTGAIKRTFVEDPYYQYTIDEKFCVGCGRCVKGCSQNGNGSLFLQVRHDRCVNCNECSIAVKCPVGAFRRVSADQPYLLKDKNNS